jgi:hypothetical protein
MAHGSISRNRVTWIGLALAALSCMVCASVRAQDPQPVAADVEAAQAGAGEAESLKSSPSEAQPMPTPIGGGMDPLGGSYYYTSPVQKLGSDLFFGSYILGALVSVVYLAVGYPLQALFGSNKVEPVMLWMLLPIIGPWFAQYEDSVKSKPFWRVVLVGDAVVQASGAVLGLIGFALSGRRAFAPQRATGVELKLGVAGAGLAGITLSVNTL